MLDLINQKKNLTQKGVSSGGRVRNSSEKTIDPDAIQKTNEAIAEARAHGDLKENAEYHAAKEEQSHNEGRIAEINDIIARANVIDVTKINNDGKVIFGSTTVLVDLKNDRLSQEN